MDIIEKYIDIRHIIRNFVSDISIDNDIIKNFDKKIEQYYQKLYSEILTKEEIDQIINEINCPYGANFFQELVDWYFPFGKTLLRWLLHIDNYRKEYNKSINCYTKMNFNNLPFTAKQISFLIYAVDKK